MGLENLSNETLFFIGFIILLTVFFHVRYSQKISEQAPTILTTLGIFATFFAIALGLLRFDSVNIQESVPALLDSMKTAFWASVFGVGGALTFNFRRLIEKTDYVDESDINQELLKELKGLRVENNQNVKELTKAKIDESELNQEFLREVKELRVENNHNLKELTKAQNDALDKISKSSSEELIKALQEVIKDFNAKINEQFGENFKQLNDAVSKLLIWQEQYKEYIDISTKSLTTLTQNVKTFIDQFGVVVENSSVITSNSETFINNAQSFKDIAEHLDVTLDNLNLQRLAIQSQIENLSKLVSKASNDLPKINDQILGIADTMQNSATNFNNHVLDIADSMQNSTKGFSKHVSGIADTMQSSAEGFNNTVSNLSNDTRNQTDALTKGIEQALLESLNSLGGQLSSMTEKFASDYNELARALARISRTTQDGGR